MTATNDRWSPSLARPRAAELTPRPGARSLPALFPVGLVGTPVLDGMSYAVSIADLRHPEQPLVYVNAAFERLTGYPGGAVLGRNCRFLQDGLPPQPAVRAVMRQAISTGLTTTVVVSNRRADGGRFDNEVALSGLRSPDGLLTHMVAVQRDVTADLAARSRRDTLLGESREVAHVLQRTLQPPPLHDVHGLEVAGRYEPARRTRDSVLQVGGDFFDELDVPGGRLLVLGDVAGRGAPAAALTGLVRWSIRALAAARPVDSPGGLLQALNGSLLGELGDRFVTVAALGLDAPDAAGWPVTVALAGHPAPWWVTADGVAPVGRPGTLLGAVAEVEVHDTVLVLRPGQALVCCTDGISEAAGATGQFGDDRIARVLHDAARDPQVSARGLVDALVDAALAYGGGTDDIAAIAVRAPG